MQYRRLGKTELQVGVIGLGAAQIGSSTEKYAARLLNRALDLGVNYIDTARGYRDSEIKIGKALKGRRDEFYLSTKTDARSKDEARRHIGESLERLQMEYVDNVHLHGVSDLEDLEVRIGPGGALEALIEAKEAGLTRFIGISSHTSEEVLIEAFRRYPFDVTLFPLNFVERRPLEELIPLAQELDIGLTVMKPLGMGLLPAGLALKYLLSQPIHCICPGTTTLEELEENVLTADLSPAWSASAEEELARLGEELESVRCRVCNLCQPCPKGIDIGALLGMDVMVGHHRAMGPSPFREFPWGPEVVGNFRQTLTERLASVESCDRCGECEERCPYGLPIIQMLKELIQPYNQMLEILSARFPAAE